MSWRRAIPWQKRPVVAVLVRLNRTLWRDIHEDSCGARHCGGASCCTCMFPPDYVRDWRHNR